MRAPVPSTLQSTLPAKSTQARRLAWLPVTTGLVALGAGAATGGIGWIVGGAVAALSGAWGTVLWRSHRRQRADLAQEAFEAMALRVYREHRGKEITKEAVVRDHRLHPDEAERVLSWLVSHDLLETDWDDLDGPMVFTRQGTAADIPAPPPLAGPPAVAGRGRGVIRHHQRRLHPAQWSSGPRSAGLAGALSLFIPGVGQIYAGAVGRGLAFLLCTGLAWASVFGIPFYHLWSAVDASKVAHRANEVDATAQE
jgi:hypothetical protein